MLAGAVGGLIIRSVPRSKPRLLLFPRLVSATTPDWWATEVTPSNPKLNPLSFFAQQAILFCTQVSIMGSTSEATKDAGISESTTWAYILHPTNTSLHFD